MKQRSGQQKRVLSLIDGYLSDYGGDHDASSKAGQLSRMISTMERWPGHWFLVGQCTKKGSVLTRAGTRAIDMRSRGCEAQDVDGRVYARAAGDGVPLSALVKKTENRPRTIPLPAVTSDRFGWSQNELANAAATARAWLFPIEGIAA